MIVTLASQLLIFLALATYPPLASEAIAARALGPPPQKGVHKDVPYVPTRHETVAEMLRLARVDSDDLVYDLGSGDGRIVITAAKELGARGVGIDIDPIRVREANENAAAAGVTDRVRFIEGDLFDADLRDATAVTLYLLPDVNIRLRPKLFDELRPGTPVVSHDFSMGEWEPEERTELDGDVVFLWIMPARVQGTWTWPMPDGTSRTARFDQEFQTFTGSVTGAETGLTVRIGRLLGETISFELSRPGERGKAVERYTGRVIGDTLSGTVTTADGTRSPWIARHE